MALDAKLKLLVITRSFFLDNLFKGFASHTLWSTLFFKRTLTCFLQDKAKSDFFEIYLTSHYETKWYQLRIKLISKRYKDHDLIISCLLVGGLFIQRLMWFQVSFKHQSRFFFGDFKPGRQAARYASNVRWPADTSFMPQK